MTAAVNRVRLIQWANGRGKDPVPLALLGDNEVLGIKDATIFGDRPQREWPVQQRRYPGQEKTREAQVMSVVKSLGDERCERFPENLAATPPEHLLEARIHLGNQSLMIRGHGGDSCFLKHLINVHRWRGQVRSAVKLLQVHMIVALFLVAWNFRYGSMVRLSWRRRVGNWRSVADVPPVSSTIPAVVGLHTARSGPARRPARRSTRDAISDGSSSRREVTQGLVCQGGALGAEVLIGELGYDVPMLPAG